MEIIIQKTIFLVISYLVIIIPVVIIALINPRSIKVMRKISQILLFSTILWGISVLLLRYVYIVYIM